MRNLVSAIIAALFAAVTMSAVADDTVKTNPNPAAKPGRAVDDTLKSGGAASAEKPGRAAEEPAADGKKKKKKGKKETQ